MNERSVLPVFREPKLQSPADLVQLEGMVRLFEKAREPLADRIDAFPKFASRRALAKFLVRHELFRRVLGVNGAIVECGVLHGAGLFTFAQLSSIYEPYNHTRRVIGFDTFTGIAAVSRSDTASGTSSHLAPGALAGASVAEMSEAIAQFDVNRPLAHIPRIELVEGDLRQTAAQYVKDNPHLVVSLLYLDVDLYEPTKAALEAFVPRMPKGAVLVFDELNTGTFPGETIAVDEVLGLRNLPIERTAIDPYISYCVL
jgi:hypothetical protein